MSKIAKIISDYKDYDVLVEGNTDDVPINTSNAKMKNIRNNWDLSCLRAASVVQYLQDHFGVNPKRLTAGVTIALPAAGYPGRYAHRASDLQRKTPYC